MWYLARVLILVLMILHKGLLVGCATPVYVWPLVQASGNAEVMVGRPQPAMGCQVATAALHPSIPANVIHFDGTEQAYVDLLVGTGHEFDDFSLSFFINPHAPITGTILHAKSLSTDDSEDVLLEMMLESNATHLLWTMADINGIFSTNAIIENPMVEDTWFPFAINYREGSGAIKMMTADLDLLKLLEDSSSGRILGLPMTIRLARRLTDPPDSFPAGITCFTMYDTSVNKDHFPNALQDCLQSNWRVTPANTGFLSQTCSNLQGYFNRLAADERPVDGIAPIVSMTARSSALCGQACIQHGSCMTFTFKKTSQTCVLYSGIHTQLGPEIGTHYYKRRDLCC